MNRLCYQHLNSPFKLRDEDEEKLVDYLSDLGIEVDIDTNIDDMCAILLATEPYVHKKTETTENISPKVTNYGDLDINLYMRLAMNADRKTLESMMMASKAHYVKFDEKFFKKYLEINYPFSLIYKPKHISYKNYYLILVRDISELWEKYNFPYIPNDKLNIISVYDQVQRMIKNNVESYHIPKFLNNIGLINAARINNINLVKEFVSKGASTRREAILNTNDREIINYLESV